MVDCPLQLPHPHVILISLDAVKDLLATGVQSEPKSSHEGAVPFIYRCQEKAVAPFLDAIRRFTQEANAAGNVVRGILGEGKISFWNLEVFALRVRKTIRFIMI
jgi:hypothetical protein